MKPATIKDIAKTLGISTSTVSRALLGRFDISEETKQAVLALAKKLDYYPDPTSLSLLNKKSRTIGVVIPEVQNNFFALILNGIMETVYKAGYRVVTYVSNESYQQEEDMVRHLVHSKVDGVILAIANETARFDHVHYLYEKGIPLVFIDRFCEEIKAPRVLFDNYGGAFDLTNHLINKGARKIAHLAGPQNHLNCVHRLNGYKDALRAHGMDIDEDLIIPNAHTQQEAYEGTLRLLRYAPDALFCVNLFAVFGAVRALREAGVAIPDEMQLAAFNSDSDINTIFPAVISVIPPAFELGKASAVLLLRYIADPTSVALSEVISLRTTLLDMND